MAYVVLALLALPLVGMVFWLFKKILKLSFSVAKLMAVLLVGVLVYSVVTGGLQQTIDGFGKPKIEATDEKYKYTSILSEGELDLTDIHRDTINIDINSAISKIKVKLPPNTVAIVKFSGAALNVLESEDKQFYFISEKDIVAGHGDRLIRIDIKAAICELSFEQI